MTGLPPRLKRRFFSGGYPRIFDRQLAPADWLRSYVATYLERDVRTISNIADLALFQRFVELCAGRTAQLLNYSSLANDCGISQPSAKAWLSVLEASFIAFRLPAFSREHAQATREDAEALFLRQRPGLLAPGHPSSRISYARIRFADRFSRPGSSPKS